VAVLPLWLGVCWLGLAVGFPVLPVWLELLVVGAVGTLPVLWMQWFRPFYIFSFLVVAVKPEKLTVLQGRLLSCFKTRLNQCLAIVVAILLVVVLGQLYHFAPLATPIAPLPPEGRLWGLLLAALAFLLSNLFLQVPVSGIAVLLTTEGTLAKVEPYLVTKICQDFTILGWQVNQILPPVISDTALIPSAMLEDQIAAISPEKAEVE
jgi:ABC-type enterochelin transport system permease subunit